MSDSSTFRELETSLGPTLKGGGEGILELDLRNLRIFTGLSILSRTLGEEVFEQIRNGIGDVTIFYKINPNINQELLNLHIGYIQIYARAGVLKDILLFKEEFQDHLRTVFGTFQRQVWAKKIHPEFYGENPETCPACALVFPFHHTSPNENIDYQFILERVPNQKEPGEFFFRLTVENYDRANIDLTALPHVIVDDIGSRIFIAGSTKIAEAINNGILSAAQRGEKFYVEENRSFSKVFEQIEKTPLGKLDQISVFWDKTFSDEIIKTNPVEALPLFKKIFLILEDQEITKHLKEGFTVRAQLADEIWVYIDLSRLDRVLNFSFNVKRTTLDLNHYLKRMPILEKIANRENHSFDLIEFNVFLIHHITSEIIALIETFRRLGSKRLTVAFVKYGGVVPANYLDVLLDVPTDHFYMSGLQLRMGPKNKIYYSVSPLYSDSSKLKNLYDRLEKEKLGFFDAMKLLSGHLFLNLLLDSYQKKEKTILVEDGGYVAPFFNEFALSGKDMGFLCKEYSVIREVPEMKVADFLMQTLVGSVEHTRNGYDRLKSVQDKNQKLFLPSFSIAISDQKVREESKEVAYSILNAIEAILNGQGMILSSRKVLILGAKGNIGSYLCKYLESRLHETNQDLIQVDIQFSKSERFNCRTIGEIEREEFLSRDLILGVVGCSILKREHFEDLILNGTKSKILIASGSTKTAEYTDLIHWLDELSFSEDKKIGGHPVRLEFDRILDPQSGIDQGGKVSFFVSKDGVEIEKTFFLLSDLSPINFLFYGVPTEGMDAIIGQLASVALGMADQSKNGRILPPGLYAVDHEIDTWGNPI
ncbi:hypothetical protein [Leptospira borgpetersenii]|uniref:Uncharacterized protein n=1 Tax=Leptospira borgpetersenii serovar Hardjo-bovis (strain JB197) TaxID=355277 RepID=Q04Q31_LEPBJ|nr:hypothetical protein [Leptospira borgpetersenii]ABJ76989.1 Hypothetical protein LBJ_2560 [Leptospira borgpetersenii serovar Hardjo-bovis str. JB197]AMX72254.1 hypothetical protein LBHB_13765 [Leptospira borgpetersenii serovar Hardjo]TQE55696.1 hypothetical protein FFZ96_12200 [Leptospira borgpetersenii]